MECRAFGACCSIQAGAILDEKVYHFKVADGRGCHERRIALGIALVYVRARRYEDFDDGLTGLEGLRRITTRSAKERRTSIDSSAH